MIWTTPDITMHGNKKWILLLTLNFDIIANSEKIEKSTQKDTLVYLFSCIPFYSDSPIIYISSSLFLFYVFSFAVFKLETGTPSYLDALGYISYEQTFPYISQ